MTVGSQLALPEEISIINVDDWKTRLLAFANEPTPHTFDASLLTRVDTAALQLFAVFAAELASNGKTFSWQSPTPELIQTARHLGLERTLSLG